MDDLASLNPCPSKDECVSFRSFVRWFVRWFVRSFFDSCFCLSAFKYFQCWYFELALLKTLFLTVPRHYQWMYFY